MRRRELLLLGVGAAAATLTGCDPRTTRPATPGPTTPSVLVSGPWSGNIGAGWSTLSIDESTVTMDYRHVLAKHALTDERRAQIEDLARYLQLHPPRNRECVDGSRAGAHLSNPAGFTIEREYHCTADFVEAELQKRIEAIAPPRQDVWLGEIEYFDGSVHRLVQIRGDRVLLSPTPPGVDGPQGRPYTEAWRAQVDAAARAHPSPATPAGSGDGPRVSLATPSRSVSGRFDAEPARSAYLGLVAMFYA